MAELTVCMPVLLSLYSFFLSPIILSLISHMPFLICCFYFRYVLKHFTILITFVSDAGTDHLYFFKMSGNTLILYTPQTIVMQLFTHSCFIFIYLRTDKIFTVHSSEITVSPCKTKGTNLPASCTDQYLSFCVFLCHICPGNTTGQ